jgi:hypothetical protein
MSVSQQLNACDRHEDLHAMAGMEIGKKRGNDRTGDASEQSAGCFENGNFESLGDQHRGHFEPDIASTDNDRAPPGTCRRANARCIIRRPQLEDAFQCRRARKVPRRSARAQGQKIVLQPLTRGQLQCAGRAIEQCHALAEPQLHATGGIMSLWPQQNGVECLLPRQNGFGQRWTMVWQVRFLSNEHDAPGPAFLAQLHRERRACMPGPHNDTDL